MIARYTVKAIQFDKYHHYDPDKVVYKIFDRQENCYGFTYYYTHEKAEKVCEKKNSK